MHAGDAEGVYAQAVRQLRAVVFAETWATFAYCDGIAPGETERTCREIGAISNFREKVKNSEIWQLHQRAYKKYFARTRKGTMSRAEFEIWSREAEQLRDRALEEYDRERDAEKKEAIVQRLKEQLNRI